MFDDHVFVYDPLLVFGFAAIGLVAVLSGAAICIFVACYTHRRKVKAKSNRTWKKLRGKVNMAGMHYGIQDLSANGRGNTIAFSVGQLHHAQLVEAGQLATQTTLVPSEKTFFTIGRKWTSDQIKTNAVAPEPQVTTAQPVQHVVADPRVAVVQGVAVSE